MGGLADSLSGKVSTDLIALLWIPTQQGTGKLLPAAEVLEPCQDCTTSSSGRRPPPVAERPPPMLKKNTHMLCTSFNSGLRAKRGGPARELSTGRKGFPWERDLIKRYSQTQICHFGENQAKSPAVSQEQLRRQNTSTGR